MSVQINWKICDNDKACSGIEVCPTGALYWNEAEGTIGINNDLCINCRKCITDGCPIGAIIVTDSSEQYQRVQQEMANDSRDKAQLFVDRFGAAPISDIVLITKDEISKKTLSGITLVERFTDSSIQCLLHSIKVDDVRFKEGLDFSFYKCEDDDGDETKEYPILDIYIDGVLKGSISGYYSDEEYDEFVKQIKELLHF